MGLRNIIVKVGYSVLSDCKLMSSLWQTQIEVILTLAIHYLKLLTSFLMSSQKHPPLLNEIFPNPWNTAFVCVVKLYEAAVEVSLQ